MLTLDAGDQSQGTLYYTTYGGKAEIQMMNAIGFDAMGVGNHEFNRGPESLAEMIATATFPVVSGNIRVAEGSPLAGHIQPRVVIEKDGERIGILGVTTPETVILSSPGPDVSFDDEIEFLQGAVAEMQAEGITKILLLSHVGYNRDREIAAAVDGISAIIGGHSHTRMSNTEEGAVDVCHAGRKPLGPRGAHRAGLAFSRYLGELQLDFAEDGAVVSASATPCCWMPASPLPRISRR